MKVWLKCNYEGNSSHIFTARAQKSHNTTSVIKSDPTSDPTCQETYTYAKSWLKRDFVGIVLECQFLPYSLHLRFSAHARKTGSCCPILMPNELVLTILVPNHRAKFGDDRLRIADARVVRDGQTDRHRAETEL